MASSVAAICVDTSWLLLMVWLPYEVGVISRVCQTMGRGRFDRPDARETIW